MTIPKFLFFLLLFTIISCGKDDGSPKSIIIRTMTIANLPQFSPDGTPWDTFDNPDVTVEINGDEEFSISEFDLSQVITISNIEICYGDKLKIKVVDKDALFGDDTMLDDEWETDFPVNDTSISLGGSSSTIIIENYELIY
ncbi:MAG: putative ubiquitin-like protein YukD [Saprospiraceae bacterium]|jgi:uncharacterized ubiquitin-like protein YukD|tara:strand:- start:65 stop:487 length:423 start_codon:yes stop_codon:yes gene_type:complete